MSGTWLSGSAVAFAVVYSLEGVAVAGQKLVGFWSSFDRSLRNWREAMGNVKRWNEKKDMVSRWVASGLLWAEAGLRKVRGHQDLCELHEALSKDGATRRPPRKLSSA